MTATPPSVPPRDSDPGRPDPGAPPEAPLERIEAAVEHAVERVEHAVDSAIEVADRSLAARFGARTMRVLRGAGRALAIGLVALWFTFGIAVLVTRHLLVPQIDHARGWIERETSRALGAQVTAARIEASWSGLNPTLRLADVQVRDERGALALALPQLDATVSWLSAPLLSLRFASLSIVAPELEVRRLAERRWSVGGIELQPDAGAGDGSRVLDWLLAQKLILVRDARLRYVDARGAEPRETVFDDVHIALAAGFSSNVVSLQARPPARLAGAIDVRARIEHGLIERAGDLARWDGQVYAEVGFADFAQIEALAEVLPAGMRVERGQGAVRAWLDFEDLAVRRVVADLAVSDVVARLASDLEPLRVASVRGRFAHRTLAAPAPGHELTLTGFALQQADRALLAPTDLKLRRLEAQGERAARTELTVGRLDLDTLAALAQHVPLARDLRGALARLEPRGIVSDLVLALDGPVATPERYSVRTRFEGLSIAAQPASPPVDAQGHPRAGVPGATGLDGSLEATEAGGAATVRASRALLDLPGVFEAPRIALDQFSAALRWSTAPQWSVRLESLNAANADFEVNASGSWVAADGPGTIDLSAKVPRLSVRAAPRYVPLAVGATTRAWLAEALREGRATEGAVRVRGDLRAFPFAQPGSGEFRASVRVRDGDLAIQPAPEGASRPPWPLIEDIDADVVFERQSMRIATRSARVYGARITPSEVQIPDLLSYDGHLLVAGGANGPLADLLRFVASSPVAGWTGHALDEASGTGNARVELKFDMPLWHARDTLVEGRVLLANNDVTLWRDFPAFTRTSGRVEFSASGFRIEPTTAGFLGGTVRVDGGTRPDGRIVLSAAGTATPAGARRLTDIAPLLNVLDRTQGTTNYRAQVALAPGSGRRPEIRVESDLVGWSVDATAPLRKTTSESMPLLLEMGLPGPDPRNPRRDEVRFTIGSAMAGRFERAAETDARPGRGTLALGAAGGAAPAVAPGPAGADVRALALPASGFQVLIDLPRLDADRLLALIGATAGGNAVAGAPPAGTAGGVEGAGSAPPFPAPDRIAAEVRELTFGGKAVSQLRLGALKGADGAWRASVASEQVNGTVVWRPPSPGQTAGGVVARLKRLAIEPRETEVLDLLDQSTTSVPALDITADEFVLGRRALGRLELAAANSGSGAGAVWTLSKLELAAPEARLHGSGQWRREPGQTARTMSLDLTLDFTDAGALLARLGMADAVRGGTGQLAGALSWRGSPFAIDYPSLGGALKLAGSKGQFLKAEPGAARLLGVISLQSLPRRITLDFRDVFSEGFAFDGISATAEMKSGVMRTKDFRMNGPSATVLLEGSTDLRAETQALHVVVVPELNLMAGSLAYALLANPAIGIGTFVAQLLLKDPLSKALSYEFDVGGSWSDPTVTRRARAAAPEATPYPAR